jgi:hypothetical protein
MKKRLAIESMRQTRKERKGKHRKKKKLRGLKIKQASVPGLCHGSLMGLPGQADNSSLPNPSSCVDFLLRDEQLRNNKE